MAREIRSKFDVEFTSAFRMIETVKPMTQPPASPLSRGGGVLGGQVAFAERECTRG